MFIIFFMWPVITFRCVFLSSINILSSILIWINNISLSIKRDHWKCIKHIRNSIFGERIGRIIWNWRLNHVVLRLILHVLKQYSIRRNIPRYLIQIISNIGYRIVIWIFWSDWNGGIDNFFFWLLFSFSFVCRLFSNLFLLDNFIRYLIIISEVLNFPGFLINLLICGLSVFRLFGAHF